MNPVQKHFRGSIDGLRWDDHPAGVHPGDDVDLRDIARRSMNYFIHNAMPSIGYGCRFGNTPLDCPHPAPAEDLVAAGDTDVRTWSMLAPLRQLSGVTDRPDVDAGIRGRVLGYLGSDGISHIPWASSCSEDLPADTMVGTLWTTGMTIRGLAEEYLATGDATAAATAGRLVSALICLAHWDTGRAYYPGWARLEGEWIGGVFGKDATLPVPLVSDVLHYGTTCGDERAVEFGLALARGIAAGFPGDERLRERRFREDGRFTDHAHLHTRVVWGVVMAGRVCGEPALTEWARRVYEFVRSRGADYGWFPERAILPEEHPHDRYEERVDVSETCVAGDMLQIAAELAQSGYPHYWDHVDRIVRNYVRVVQVALTPETERLYRQMNRGCSPEAIERGLAGMAAYEGGFLSDIAVNDLNGLMGPMCMAGCCPPEAARALVTAWRGTVMRSPEGFRVNLAFPHESEVASVDPRPGALLLRAREAGTYLLRPPAWTDRTRVEASLDGMAIHTRWRGDYVAIEDVAAGASIELRWPVPCFQQTAPVGGRVGGEHPYTFEWAGNTLVRILPAGVDMPIFTGK